MSKKYFDENDSFLIEEIKELQKQISNVQELLEPKLYVCTQSGKSIVPVDNFFVDGTGGDEFIFIAAHRGSTTWQILGVYSTMERALQVYKEMLQCPKTDVYIMPKE